MAKTDLLQGTLDLLLLRTLALGPNHGWGISNRIRQTSSEGLQVSQGSSTPRCTGSSCAAKCDLK